MSLWRIPMTAVLMMVLAASGCSSIQSKAVRGLITKEGEKIQQARKNFDGKVGPGIEDRIILTENALQRLGSSLAILRANETAQWVIFKSYQNVATKTGVDAQAAAYLIGIMYMDEHEGLEKKVLDQFNEDFRALRQERSHLSDSWKSLELLNDRIQDYANKSVFASTDPGLIEAAVQHIPGGSMAMDAALRHSEQVNAALEEIIGFGVIRGGALERGRSISTDLIDLLERVKHD